MPLHLPVPKFGLDVRWNPATVTQHYQERTELLPEQTRLSVLGWNPGGRHSNPNSLLELFGPHWQIIICQEAGWVTQHLTEYWVIHTQDLVIAFNRDTFLAPTRESYREDIPPEVGVADLQDTPASRMGWLTLAFDKMLGKPGEESGISLA